MSTPLSPGLPTGSTSDVSTLNLGLDGPGLGARFLGQATDTRGETPNSSREGEITPWGLRGRGVQTHACTPLLSSLIVGVTFEERPGVRTDVLRLRVVGGPCGVREDS